MILNKICLITGAAQGIGKAITIKFASEGGKVFAIDRNFDKLSEWISEYNKDLEFPIQPIELDILNASEVKKVITEIYKEVGKIDCLVNNAGVVFNRKIGMITREETSLMFNVNVIATIELTQLVSRLMSRKKHGSIINIASITAVLGSTGQSAYSATKGAIISFTKSAAKELAPLGIRVNAVAPGIIETERFNELYMQNGESIIENRINKIGLGRLGKPEDVANACAFLASDNSSYISGQILGVDGCASI